MANTNSGWQKFFIGFGIVTVISGIFLIYQKDYFIGVSGSFVGAFLIYLQTVQNSKDHNSSN